MSKHEEVKAAPVIEEKASGTDLVVYDFGEDAGAGMENVTKDEYVLPFLKIVQANSPAAKEIDRGGLGARAGQIMNTATGELFDGKEGIDALVVYRDHNFVERWPYDTGKGFVGIRGEDDDLVAELRAKQGQFGRLKTADGTEIAETYYFYLVLVDKERNPLSRALQPFASTQIKKYRSMISRFMAIKYPSRDRTGKSVMVNPPMWAHIVHISTVPEKKGANDFYGWRIALKSEPPQTCFVKMSDPLYAVGKEFHGQIVSGEAKVDYSKVADEGDGEGNANGGQASGGQDVDAEIPF